MNIWQASRAADIERLKLLLRRTAPNTSDVNKFDQFGFAPIHWAVQEGHITIVQLLIKNGADCNSRDADGQTPLHWAVDRGFTDIMKLLVEECHCDLNGQDRYQHTALHRAAALGNTETVRFLVDHGVDVELKNQNGWTALHVACYYYHLDIVSILVEGNNVNIPNKDGWTPLHCCSMQGFADVATILLRHGADIDYRSKDGSTPLHLAAQEGKAPVVDVLIKHRADINITNTKGKKPEGTTTEVNNILSTKSIRVPDVGSVKTEIVIDKGTIRGIKGQSSTFTLKIEPKVRETDLYIVFTNRKTNQTNPNTPSISINFGFYYSFQSKLIEMNPKNNHYVFSFTPPLTIPVDRYQMHLKVCSDSLPGSPFDVPILSNDGSGNYDQTVAEEEIRQLREKVSSLQLENSELKNRTDLNTFGPPSKANSGTSLLSSFPIPPPITPMSLSANIPLPPFPNNLPNCVVCKVNERDTVVLPCLHFAFCRNCLGGHSTCPTCETVLCGFLKVKMT